MAGKPDRWCVHSPLNGAIIAFVEKYPPEPDYRHPFKVFKPQFIPGSRPQRGQYVGSSYRARTPEAAVMQFIKDGPVTARPLNSFGY